MQIVLCAARYLTARGEWGGGGGNGPKYLRPDFTKEQLSHSTCHRQLHTHRPELSCKADLVARPLSPSGSEYKC